MQIFVFNLANSRMRRFTSGVIYANSYPNTVFKFNFNTPDWDLATTKTAVFSYRGENHNEPLDENNMCKVPKEVLHEGCFLVSVYGNGVPTNSIRIPVAKAPEELLPDNGDVKSGVVFVPEISERVDIMGHNGSHPLFVDDFVRAVTNKKMAPVTPWMAAHYTITGIYAHKSAMMGSVTLKLPEIGEIPEDFKVIDYTEGYGNED
jgi:hypothetical protein